MVVSMAYRDTEVAAVPDVAEGALVRTPQDWRRLYEQTLERAEAAEARAEELKWAEVVARSAAGFVEVAVQGGAPQAACGGRRRERGPPRGEERGCFSKPRWHV